jgi:hypothetical protein
MCNQREVLDYIKTSAQGGKKRYRQVDVGPVGGDIAHRFIFQSSLSP